MAVFDVSFLNPKLRKSGQDYGFMIDSLDMKRNQLEADGKLAPSDYDLLIKQAQKIYSHPGLTPAQKSNVAVKISSYQSDKKRSILSQKNDIQRLNNELKDDHASAGMAYGANPEMLIKAHADSLFAKLNILTESINNLQNAGDDATIHILEYNAAKSDYYDLLNAYEDVKNYDKSSKPTGNYVAYIDTNPRGEIINVSIGRVGSKSGYYETNGLYGGLQIYGNKTRKEGDQAIFQIGKSVFQNVDMSLPDASGVMKPAVLVAGGQKAGARTLFRGEKYQDVDLDQVSTQSAFRTGDWIEGQFLYQKQDNGYIKHVNPDKTKLGISDGNIMPIPKYLESSILNNVVNTIDDSQLYIPQVPAGGMNIAPSTAASAPATATVPALTPPVSRGNAPTARAPQTVGGYAAATLGKARSFLSDLFKGIKLGGK